MTKADPAIRTVPEGYSSVSPWIITRDTERDWAWPPTYAGAAILNGLLLVA